MNDLILEDRLKPIEQLLVANKEVLILEEACECAGISFSEYLWATAFERTIVERITPEQLEC